MNPSFRYQFELLTDSHSVTTFDCHNTWLNLYLQNNALSETKRDLARTFVLLDTTASSSETLLGYFTLRLEFLNYMEAETLQTVFLPVVELCYLARDVKHRGKGVGEILLIEALRHVGEAARWVNVAGISLYATQEGRKLYERFGFGEHPYGEPFMLIGIENIRTVLQSLSPPPSSTNSSNGE